MIDSRCGILCSECDSQEDFGVSCDGCLNAINPFWGECSLKSCCEEKGLEYCGACDEFPCELLNNFSYDKQSGDNGKRIERCQNLRFSKK